MLVNAKAFLVIGLIAFSLLIVSIGYAMTADRDADYSLREATKQAMYIGVNKGAVRVQEEVTLNKEMTEAAFVRSIAEQSRFEEGSMDVYVHQIESKPALMATEVYHTFDTPFLEYLKWWNHDERPTDTTVREKETAIFEAKQFIRP